MGTATLGKPGELRMNQEDLTQGDEEDEGDEGDEGHGNEGHGHESHEGHENHESHESHEGHEEEEEGHEEAQIIHSKTLCLFREDRQDRNWADQSGPREEQAWQGRQQKEYASRAEECLASSGPESPCGAEGQGFGLGQEGHSTLR